MNTQPSAVSRGGLSSTLTTTTGAYSTVAARDISQTNEVAPAAEACLLNRFQVACATAATRMRVRAVALTGRLQVRAPGRAGPGMANESPRGFYPVRCGRRRRLAPLGPARPALVVGARRVTGSGRGAEP